MISRDQFIQMTDQQQWDEYSLVVNERESLQRQNRPQEGNAILRIDLELPVEELDAIIKRHALRTSIETV